MQAELTVFDSARIKLQRGIHLVEASAGTGKTYAIGMLVLRCVAELAVPIDKILIVTFTKAATEELRSRIRARLVEARDLLLGDFDKADPTLRAWEQTVLKREEALTRIQLALLDIDRASIFTIHSFCQRMLQEQALESGQLFDVELLADIDHIRHQVADDFWRSRVYNLAPLPCGILTNLFLSPENILASVVGIKGDTTLLEPIPLRPEDAVDALEESFTAISSWWQQHAEPLFGQFAENREFFNKALREHLDSWWQQLDDFFAGRSVKFPDGLEYLTREGLMSVLNGKKLRGEDKKRIFLANWILPQEQVEVLQEAMAQLVLAFRAALAHVLAREVEQRLQQQGGMSFDDLILRLARALGEEGGGELLQILATRYNVALIDEFQDTDAEQWYIFSTLFGGGQHYLYLIGDPKQAIYRFRGADINSYFEAREAAHYYLTLEKNYRTHPHLVEEVNNLFLSRTRPFSFENMAYYPVVPAKTIEDGWLQRGGQALANMAYCQLPEYGEEKSGRWSSGRAAEYVLHFTVAEVSRLLDGRTPVHLTGKDLDRRITPKDIAILVRTNRQAQECLQILADGGIPAVMASKRSVFHTDEAHEIYILLQALAAPGDTRLFKTAMTITWFGFSGNDLVAIWQDDSGFDGWHGRFLLYFQLWKEQGVLTMMDRLLVEEQVFITLAEERFAERRIANIHHLLELIQEVESSENFGPGQTLQWLHNMILETQGTENAELRLESDEDAVRVLTMHGAKGLEYPIVFCPFLWYRSSRLKREKFFISCYDEGPVMDLGSERFEARRKLAMAEELAEDLRLLYVALTRAGQRCYVMWADVKPFGLVDDSFSSALGYLLFPEGKVVHDVQRQKLAERAQMTSVDHLYLTEQTCCVEKYRQEDGEFEELVCRQPSGRSLKTNWQMSSYSAMVALSEQREYVEMGSRPKGSGVETSIPVSGLPSGANFGNLVHDCLEEVSFATLAAGKQFSELLGEKCSRYGIEAEHTKLEQLLANIVTTPLLADNGENMGAKGFCLADLCEEHCLKEMPFYYHLDRMTTKEINRILANEPAFSPLSQRVMQGYLNGFVDLVCEHDGKFYIIDYKTNYLGEHVHEYSTEILVQAMAEHNYGLQFWIYTLVLHRYLRNVLPGYSYEHHFGGVMYLFVRGMVPILQESGVFFTRPDRDLLEKLAVCLGGDDDV